MPVRSVRRRYLWIHIETEAVIDAESLNKEIDAKIHYLYGVKGAVEMNYRLIDFFQDGSYAILRCNHNRLNEMRAALAHISAISEKPTRIDVLRVSGTIKALRKHTP
jgi:RNase P/RNase MRP subunit POP5